ncbi:MAG: divergent PAP2 family protein [Dehalococcoidales bacterium]|jgi:acid phosphatase family membrane protein YuiD|nr:divergent PAP2 family protein [Dehalococcoidales bacterium]
MITSIQMGFSSLLGDIVSNKVLIISASAWAIAQILKVLVVLVQEKRVAWNYFVTSGGMPSSHTAIVCALATSIAMIFGVNSVAFSIAVVLAVIVMYDAAGVRQSVGQQSAIINRLVKGAKLDIEKELREFIGHTPFQVFMGAVVGVLVAVIWITISGN